MLNIKSRLLWKRVEIYVNSRGYYASPKKIPSDRLEDIIDKYYSAGAGATKELKVTIWVPNLNEDYITLLATKFKNLKKLCFNVDYTLLR